MREVDLDLDRLRDVPVAVVRNAVAGLEVERLVVRGARYCTVADGFSPASQRRRASSHASLTARPPMNVMRDAEAEPAFGASAESSVIIISSIEVEIERLRGDLPEDRVRALSDVGGADAHARAANRDRATSSSTVAVACSGKPNE